MCNIDRIQNCCRIIRIYVADEFCFHFEFVVFLCPVFKCKIHCTRTKVTSADTDLNNSCEFFSCCVCNLTCMYFIGKVSDLLLLFYIESTFVNTVSCDSITKLSTCQLMKNKTFLTCIDHFAIVKSCVFFSKLCFFCKLFEAFKYIVIYLFCSIVICKTSSHRYAVFFNTLCTIFSGHGFYKVYFFYIGKFFERFKSIQVVPGNHNKIPP